MAVSSNNSSRSIGSDAAVGGGARREIWVEPGHGTLPSLEALLGLTTRDEDGASGRSEARTSRAAMDVDPFSSITLPPLDPALDPLLDPAAKRARQE